MSAKSIAIRANKTCGYYILRAVVNKSNFAVNFGMKTFAQAKTQSLSCSKLYKILLGVLLWL